jgi:hypothetical protein
LDEVKRTQDIKILNEKRAARAMALRKIERESLGSKPNARRDSLYSAAHRYSLIDGRAVMRSSMSLPDSNEFNDSLEGRSRSAKNSPIVKESVKLNVESINDRFISSLLNQERTGRGGRKLASLFPSQIKNTSVAARISQRKVGSLKPLTEARRSQISISTEDHLLKSSQFSFDFC